MTRLWIDAHLDLAMNMIQYDRDITLSLEEMNRVEAHQTDAPFRGRGTVTLPEMRKAGIPICVATVIARSGPGKGRPAAYKRADIDYGYRDGAFCTTMAQWAYYELLERRGHVRILRTASEVKNHWQEWSTNRDKPVPLGIILSMEGADPVFTPEDVAWWFKKGLRAIGPAHYGVGVYAGGTRTNAPFTEDGLRLLDEMAKVGMVLDVTHLSDAAMDQAFERFTGHLWASHHNCRALAPWDRQLTDEQIKTIGKRDGVIGLACDAIMIFPGWVLGQTDPELLSFEDLANHLDHMAQLLGGVRNIAIGTDLDGGYGTEQTPRDLKTIADVQKLGEIMLRRGYKEADVDAVFHGNWLRKFGEALPK